MALTQLRAFGACTGARYGSFARGAAPGTHPVGKLTQARAHSAHTGSRYRAFAGRQPEGEQFIPTRIRVPRNLIDAQRLRMIEADDVLLLIAGSIAAGLLQ